MGDKAKQVTPRVEGRTILRSKRKETNGPDGGTRSEPSPRVVSHSLDLDAERINALLPLTDGTTRTELVAQSQHTVGNRAVQRLVQAHNQKQAGAADAVSTHNAMVMRSPQKENKSPQGKADKKDQKKPASDKKEPKTPAESNQVCNQAGLVMDSVTNLVNTATFTLVPAYHKAVDALDPPGALQLATAVVTALKQIEDGYQQASDLTQQANPYAMRVSRADQPDAPVLPDPTADELAEYTHAQQQLDELSPKVRSLELELLIEMGPQRFRGQAVLGSYAFPPHGNIVEAVTFEASTTVDLLITYHEIQRGLEVATAPKDRDDDLDIDPEDRARDEYWKWEDIARKIAQWRSRPVNFQFLKYVLMSEGLWVSLLTSPVGHEIAGVSGGVQDQARVTGNFADVGEFDAKKAKSLLSYGWTDWAVTDDDAQEVFKMVMSAAPIARAQVIEQIDAMGRLGRLCDNLPWRYVQAMHDSVDDPKTKAKLAKYYEGKGGGESLSKRYEENIMGDIQKGKYVRGYLWTLLKTAHNALTFGFLDVHDAAYDAKEEGWISSDAYWSTTAKAAARSTALGAVTAVTGGAASAWGEGVALGLNAGKTTAQIIGAGFGGAVSGVSGQFTADVYDQALLGKEGFSSLGDYGLAAGMGAGSGIILGGVQAAGSKYFDESVKTMSQVYAEKYPQLDNVLTRIRSSGVRTGLRIQVTGQELAGLARAGLVNSSQLQDALGRIGAVYQNDRIDISQPLSRVHPQSEIEKVFGPVDPSTGQVTVLNPEPTSGGYSGVTDQFPPGARATDTGVRDALGINGPNAMYDKYKNVNDPLFEVVFKTDVELDVPLPSANKQFSPTKFDTLGAQDPSTSHMVGTGRTSGGVQEGILPRGAPIEIIDIRPVGTPRASYAPTGATYSPYPPTPPSVRNIQAPLSGGVSGVTNPPEYEDEDSD